MKALTLCAVVTENSKDNKKHSAADITCTMNSISTQANKVITYLPSTFYNNTHFTGVSQVL